MNKVVSELDNRIHKKIRNNITNFIKEKSKVYDNESFSVLDIAPQVHLGAKEFFIKSKIFTADIDENSDADFIVDICENNEKIIQSNYFDLIFCNEVLEHTLNPFGAINEIHRILKKGGLLFLTTPFNFRIHGPLPDCWRFTEHGLREMMKKFEILELNSLEDDDRFLMPYHYTVVAKK